MEIEKQQRIADIKAISRKKLEEYMIQLENSEITNDEIIAVTFASICTAAIIGIDKESLIAMVDDSVNYAKDLIGLLDETLEEK
jgi:hypothetical protein